MNQDHHLAAAYALDALTPDERQRYEAHYPTCEICAAEVSDFRETAALLAAAASELPPPSLKAQVLAEVGTTRQIPPLVPEPVADLAERRRRNVPRPVVLATAAAAIVALAIGFVSLRDTTRNTTVDDLLAADDTIITQLDGGNGTVSVAWSASRDQVAVLGTGLTQPPPEQTYELWLLTETGAEPAALFTPARGAISAVFDVADIDSTGWGITVEPAGGSPQPTTPILYAGTL
ncbi:MAG: anti-sigma factor [Acidimicrobiales bacterium]|nr:anti-sigma factor [Acidimicrobiales bacterium]